MNNSCQILPGIKKIYYTLCDQLQPRIDLQAIAGMKVAILSDLEEIPFFGTPECKCSTEKDKNGWNQKVSLKFRSSEVIPVDDNLAFIVGDVNDRWFVIGAKENPYPVITVEKNTGSPSGDAAGFYYEINHESLRSLIECLV